MPPPCSGRGVLFFFVVCSAPVAAWSCGSLWRPLLAARVRHPRQVCMPPCPCCSRPVFWARSFVPLGGVLSSCGRLELSESLASPVHRPRSPSASGVYAPLSTLSPGVLGMEFCSSWWCVQLLWPFGAVGVSGVPCSPPAFAVRVRCVCPLVPVALPPVFWAWSFVLLRSVFSSCGRLELWESLASPVGRQRSPSSSGVYAPLSLLSPPRVLGAEFCSSWWCVQLLWLPGAVGVSGVPCWRPAFAVLVRCACPLVPVVPSPVFWARSFVRLGGVFSSCGCLELWESLASPVGGPPAFAVRVRCVCPLVPAAPRVLGLEFCSSSWCVQLLWPPGAVGVSGVPCWPPAFAVLVRCVCPLVPVVPAPVFWAWSFVPLGGVLSSCGLLELWESLASPVRRPRSPSASGVYAPLSPLSPRVLGVEFCSS